jgi:hypothetical protein
MDAEPWEVPQNIPLGRNLAYIVEYERPRFWFFGRPVRRQRLITRLRFYDTLLATGAINQRTDFEACDVLLLTGHRFQLVGPKGEICTLRAFPR